VASGSCHRFVIGVLASATLGSMGLYIEDAAASAAK
jgi:hypothetical protein